MKTATFNANSIRARMPILLDWLEREQPDVLFLQETKVQDKDFPILQIEGTGYEITFRGQKSYNGVAVLRDFSSQTRRNDMSFLVGPPRNPLLFLYQKRDFSSKTRRNDVSFLVDPPRNP